MNLLACGSCYEGQLRFPPNYISSKMDYKQKEIPAPPPKKQQRTDDDEDEDDLEALREAALRSMGLIGSKQNKQVPQPQIQTAIHRAPQPHRQYKNHPFTRGGNYINRQSKQNGIKGFYYHLPRNPNLIEIVPVDETANVQNVSPNENKELCTSDNDDNLESTKFQRYKDEASGSEEEEQKEQKCVTKFTEKENAENADMPTDKENQSDADASPVHSKNSEDKSSDEKVADDDDDVLLMADLEEEDSLERLMDEMEREINVEKGAQDKKSSHKASARNTTKAAEQSKIKIDQSTNRKRSRSPSVKKKSPLMVSKPEQRVSSPYDSSRSSHKRRSSLSPKIRPRKKSPRRSPRRSPIRQKPRYKSPSRYSPRPRSPRPVSPLPLRTSSRCQKTRSDSPRSPIRSRKANSRSPRELRRSRSPPRKLSPQRRASPRFRSPKHSPWISPKHSPKDGDWSPKESTKRPRSTSISRDRVQEREPSPPTFDRVPSPAYRSRSPEVLRPKNKTKEETSEKNLPSSEISKTANSDGVVNPVLEARRKKFESAVPIDPVLANKKIKLTKKESNNQKKKTEEEETIKESTTLEQEMDLCLDTTYDLLESESNVLADQSPVDLTNEVDVIVNVEETKPEKERSSKKRKKKDKELYQIGKLKELPLSERIGKEKKSRRHKDCNSPTEEVETTLVEDVVIDEEGDLRAELSRRRAERLNRAVPIQSARLLQSAFKGVVKEVAKNNAKANQRHLLKGDDKLNQKEVRRVTVLHRSLSDLHNSEDDSSVDSKVPVHFRLGITKNVQDSREPKTSRKSKRQNRKVKHKTNMPVDPQHLL